jgi:hypothetical protein
MSEADEDLIPLFAVLRRYGHTVAYAGPEIEAPHDAGEYDYLHAAGIDQLSEGELPVSLGVLYQGNIEEGGNMEFNIKEFKF